MAKKKKVIFQDNLICCNLSRLSPAYSRQVDQRFMKKKPMMNLKIDMLLKWNRTNKTKIPNL